VQYATTYFIFCAYATDVNNKAIKMIFFTSAR